MDAGHDPGRSPAEQPPALPELWAAHIPRLTEFVRRRVPPILTAVLDAEDILQAAYLDAARRWEACDAIRRKALSASCYVWLYGIVMARLVEEYRRHTRAGRDQRLNLPWPQESSVQLGLSLIDAGRSPSSAFLAADASERIRQALDQLPDTDRDVLWMRHFDGLSIKEIAEHLEVGENAAAQRYVRALRKLRGVWSVLEPADGSRS